jgi:hypothetical protein
MVLVDFVGVASQEVIAHRLLWSALEDGQAMAGITQTHLRE